jgi:hypothetical protein
MHRSWVLCLAAIVLLTARAAADEEQKLPLLLAESFERGADRWQPTDAAAWTVKDLPDGKVLALVKNSDYKPPHRSPLNMVLVKDVVVDGDFILEAKLRSTERVYGHQDLCLFFGHQGPAKFYYVHLGRETDDHANQIFIVNDKPRTKISQKTSQGTAWTDGWHQVRVVRRVADGTIEVYFDDMQTPVMTAKDATFTWGRVGIGSFDDRGEFKDVRLYGKQRTAKD